MLQVILLLCDWLILGNDKRQKY